MALFGVPIALEGAPWEPAGQRSSIIFSEPRSTTGVPRFWGLGSCRRRAARLVAVRTFCCGDRPSVSEGRLDRAKRVQSANSPSLCSSARNEP